MKQKRILVVVALAAFGLGLVYLGAVSSRAATVDQAAAPGAGAPGLVSYQGYLTNDTGQPISGAVTLEFGLYADATGGRPDWQETHDKAQVRNGYFAVLLGSVNPLSPADFGDSTRFLQTAVDTGGGLVVLPRQQLASAPYALQAEQAATANTALTALTASTAITANTAVAAPWSGLTGVPSGFADDTDDIGGQYANRVVVAKSGGDYASVQSALNSIADASVSNPYLVKVMPGVYTETVTMKEYVDIEGSGEGVTTIRAGGTGTASAGTVVGASHAELRFVTVESTGGATQAVAVYSNNAAPRLTHVTLIAFGGSSQNFGFNADLGAATLDHVTVVVSGTSTLYGVFIEDGSATIRDAVLELTNGGVQHGIRTDNSTVGIERVAIRGHAGSTHNGILNDNSSIALNDVTIAAAASTFNYGLRSTDSKATITGLEVSVSGNGAGFAYGTYNATSVLTMTNGILDVRNAAFNYGLYNSSSSGTLANLSVTALDGSFDYGIYNTAGSGSYLVTLEHSRIQSSDETIRSDAEFTTRVGNTRLGGAAVNANGGTVTCAGVYDENYTFFASVCP